MFIEIKGNQTGNSSCYLRDGGGWGLSIVLLFSQLHFISISPHETRHVREDLEKPKPLVRSCGTMVMRAINTKTGDHKDKTVRSQI